MIKINLVYLSKAYNYVSNDSNHGQQERYMQTLPKEDLSCHPLLNLCLTLISYFNFYFWLESKVSLSTFTLDLKKPHLIETTNFDIEQI